jgi:hypothetical protein
MDLSYMSYEVRITTFRLRSDLEGFTLHTVIIEDIQGLFQIEDAFWGCGQTRFK